MNPIEILLNYLDIYKLLVMIIVFLLTSVIFIILSSDLSNVSDDSKVNKENASLKEKKNFNKVDRNLEKTQLDKCIEIKGFLQNTINANEKNFMFSEEIETIENLSQKLVINHSGLADKNDELSIMFIESLSSLNSWKNNEVENKLFKETNWNIEKRGNNEEEGPLVFQYVYPNLKQKESSSSFYFPNLSSSQSSLNSNSETEDGEEEKEKAILSQYKLGICRTFDYFDDNEIKLNIVKEVNGNLYKIYSEGEPYLIREKCRRETLPKNFDEIVEKYKKEGYTLIGLSGKKMKMNYLQSQKIERIKCESNMIFLGFVIYKVSCEELS